MSELIGKTFGNYQIIEQIGMGGMATVYKAYQANMDRYVAIKVLPRQFADDPTFIGRFEQEARTIAKLEHKHILPVYDYGDQDGYTYLVMRYIGTGNLKDLTQRGPLPLADVARYLVQIAEALHYAHEHGVIHRDVKTSNVLLGVGKETYLTDFGIAKLAAGSTQFTGTGTIIGTPAYMSPEQCAGMPVDARSDIYSLGIVLYEMLTGAVPFDAETPVAVVLKQIQEALPSPRTVNPAIPEAVEQVLFKTLAKDPDHRYQSAHDLAVALNRAVEGIAEKTTSDMPAPVTRTPAPTVAAATVAVPPVAVPARGGRARWWWGLLAVAVVIGVGAGVFLLSNELGGGEDEEAVPATEAVGAVTEAVAAATEAPTEEPTVTESPTSEPTAAEIPTSEPTEAPTEEAIGTPVAVAGAGWTTFINTESENPSNRQLLVTDSGMWMGTEGGLVHWTLDGQYRKYTSADGLAFNYIQALAVDTNGYVWISNGYSGVMRLTVSPDGALSDVVFYNQENSDLGSSNIWALLPGPDGTLLAGTYESYLEQWNGETWQTPDIPVPQDLFAEAVGDRVWLLKRTGDGSLWAGGPLGLVRWDGEAWTAVPLSDTITGQDEQQTYAVASFYEDPADGALWVTIFSEPNYDHYAQRLVPPASAGGDWTWEPVEAWVPLPLRDVQRAADGTLWVVGYDSAIRLDSATGQRQVFTSEQGIPGYAFQHITQDASGTIWLATTSALARYDGRRWQSFVIENEPPGNQIAAMAEGENGTLWFVNDYGQVMTYRDGTWDAVADLGEEIFDIAVQGDAVWVGSSNGLIRLQQGRTRRYTTADGLTSNTVLDLAVDPANPDLLWLGLSDGVNRVNTADGSVETWTRESASELGPLVDTLHFDAAGVLWAGVGDYGEESAGAAGLLRFDGTAWQVVGQEGDPFTVDDRAVWALADDGQGGLWVGTDLYLYHWDGADWRQYTETDGAPDDGIVGLAVAGDVVWVATQYDGLYRLDSIGWYHLGNEGTGTLYLAGMLHTSDGALWIWGDSGVTRLVGDPLEFDQ